MEQLDLESAQIKEVYAQFGLAMYQAQWLERQLAILLATKYGPDVNRITRSQYDDLLQSLFRKPFGNLITCLRKTINVPIDFDRSLGKALSYRNWLAHNYFWDRAGQFMTEKGRLFMIEELQTATDFLYDFNGQLYIMVEEWLKANGIDSDTIETHIERIAKNMLREVDSSVQP